MAVTLRNNVTLNGGIHMDTWSPQLLFPAGTQDVWYDPGDIDLTWRRNLLTYTEQFDNVAWQKNGVALTANAAIAPNNTLTAYALMETAVSDTHRVYQTTNNPNNKTTSVYAKANGRNWFRIECSGGNASVNAFFNLTTGTLGTVTAGVTATITPVGDGWYLCTAYFATHSGTVFCCSANGDNTYSYIGDATRGVYIWGAQLELGSTATPYQSITDGIADYYSYVANPPVMFQDSSGTNVVARVEQPVGLMLDKSQGLVLGSELVTNGDFATDTWWVKSGTTISGGTANWSAAASGSYVGRTVSLLTVGSVYLITWTITSISAGGLRLHDGTNFGTTRTTPGTYTEYLRASGTNFYIISTGASTTAAVDSISVKELPGNHAYQSTPNSRPYLRARHNLLTYSEQFDNAAWTLSNSFIQTNLLTYSEDSTNAAWSKAFSTATSNATIAPDGTLTADKIVVNAGIVLGSSTGAGVRQDIVKSASAITYTQSFYAKAGELNSVFLFMSNLTASSAAYVKFNLVNGTYSNLTAIGFLSVSASIISVGNGWYRCIITATSDTDTGMRNSVFPADSVATVGDGVSGIYLWGAQLVRGSVPGDYRATTSAALPILYNSPIGTVTANKLCETNATAVHSTSAFISLINGATYTYSFYVKAAEQTFIQFYGSGGFSSVGGVINLTTGAVVSGSATVENVGNGWWRISGTGASAFTGPNLIWLVLHNGTTSNYAGNGSSGVYVWGADLRVGTLSGTYQRTNASTFSTVGTLDYDPVGQKPYLWFDGTDDSLVTNSINFSGTNKMFVCAGVTKLSDAGGRGIVAELSTNIGANNGAFFLSAPASAAANYNFSSKGTSQADATTTSVYAAPITSVLSGQADISIDALTLRVNGSQAATSATDQGTGNYGNYPLYIGRRGGTTNYFNGLLYNLMIIGTQVDPVNIQKAERFVADRTGITI